MIRQAYRGFAYWVNTLHDARALLSARKNLECSVGAAMSVQRRQQNDPAGAEVIRLEHVCRAREKDLAK